MSSVHCFQILQRLTERKSELGDCTGSMSSSMELSLIEKRRSKSDEPIAQNKYKQLFLSDEKEVHPNILNIETKLSVTRSNFLL